MKVARSEADNPIARAIAICGGPSEASHVCGVSYAAIYKWRRKGICPDSRSAVRLSDRTGISVRELAGMDPKPDPTRGGGDAAFAREEALWAKEQAAQKASSDDDATAASLRPRRLYAPPSDTSGRRHTRAKKNRYSRYISIPLLHQAAIEALLEVLGHPLEDEQMLAWAA